MYCNMFPLATVAYWQALTSVYNACLPTGTLVAHLHECKHWLTFLDLQVCRATLSRCNYGVSIWCQITVPDKWKWPTVGSNSHCTWAKLLANTCFLPSCNASIWRQTYGIWCLCKGVFQGFFWFWGNCSESDWCQEARWSLAEKGTVLNKMIQNKKNGCRCHKISLDMNNMIIGTHSTYSVLYISCVQCLHHTLLHFSCKLLRSVHTDNVSADVDTRTFTVKRCKRLASSLGLLGMVKELQVQT